MPLATPVSPVVLIVAPRVSYLSKPLPKIFAQAGARVVFAAPEGCSIRASRHVNEGVAFESGAAGSIEMLEAELARLEPALLVVVEESFLERILGSPPGQAVRAKSYYRTNRSPQARSAFYAWAKSCELPVPAGEVCHDAAVAKRLLAGWDAVFLKQDGSSGGTGVRQATTDAEVEAAWDEIGDPRGVLVQKALDGAVGVTDMVVKHGRLLAWVSSEKWRTVTRHGPSVARRLCVPEGMSELARQVAQATGFNGLCGFDWVIDGEDGLPKMIEFHPRPPSGFGIGKWAGVSFGEAVAALLGKGGERLQEPDPTAFSRKPVCCYFPDHPVASLRRGDWRELRRWLPGSASRSWAMLPWDDPPVLWRMLATRPFRR
jgi:hypothetical protein